MTMFKKIFFRKTAPLFLLIFVLLAFDYPQKIRVAVVKDGGKTNISFPSNYRVQVIPSDDALQKAIKKHHSIKISRGAIGYILNSKAYPGIKEIKITAIGDKGRIRVNKRPYRGNLDIILSSKLYVVNELSLEYYVYGVLPAEISARWPMEAIKAQAVAARTYAVFIKNRGNAYSKYYDLDATTKFQVYKGSFYEQARTNKAADFTRGEIMLYNRKPIEAYFHSISGGYTEDAKDVWGTNLPYLRDVRDDFSRIAPNFYWKYKVTKKRFDKEFGVDNIKAIKLYKDKKHHLRVRKMRIIAGNGVFPIKPSALRVKFGEYNIRSNIFDVKIGNKYIFFHGQGFGHGVGLSQWGAYAMAKKGRSYRDILRYYYHNIQFKKIYEKRTF